jgi:hypothetical protein
MKTVLALSAILISCLSLTSCQTTAERILPACMNNPRVLSVETHESGSITGSAGALAPAVSGTVSRDVIIKFAPPEPNSPQPACDTPTRSAVRCDSCEKNAKNGSRGLMLDKIAPHSDLTVGEDLTLGEITPHMNVNGLTLPVNPSTEVSDEVSSKFGGDWQGFAAENTWLGMSPTGDDVRMGYNMSFSLSLPPSGVPLPNSVTHSIAVQHANTGEWIEFPNDVIPLTLPAVIVSITDARAYQAGWDMPLGQNLTIEHVHIKNTRAQRSGLSLEIALTQNGKVIERREVGSPFQMDRWELIERKVATNIVPPGPGAYTVVVAVTSRSGNVLGQSVFAILVPPPLQSTAR